MTPQFSFGVQKSITSYYNQFYALKVHFRWSQSFHCQWSAHQSDVFWSSSCHRVAWFHCNKSTAAFKETRWLMLPAGGSWCQTVIPHGWCTWSLLTITRDYHQRGSANWGAEVSGGRRPGGYLSHELSGPRAIKTMASTESHREKEWWNKNEWYMCRYVWMDCGGACSLRLCQQCCSCIAVLIRYFKIRNIYSSNVKNMSYQGSWLHNKCPSVQVTNWFGIHSALI